MNFFLFRPYSTFSRITMKVCFRDSFSSIYCLSDCTVVVCSDIQDSLLKCIIALSPRLLSLEICLAPEGVNSITG